MDAQNYCFCELAPLYALDLLTEAEQAWVEQQVADCPDLAEELATYQSAIATLPYSVPVTPIAADLKSRLFDRLALDPQVPDPQVPDPQVSDPQVPDPSVSEPMIPPPLIPHLAIRADELNWQPQGVPGVEVAIVHMDSIKRELVGFLRAEPGVRYPMHRHAAIEEIFMIRGDLVIGDAVYGAGDYIRSLPGSSHAPSTIGGCQFFFHTSMDDIYPEPVLA